MIRKWISLFLVLVMAVAMPMSALADVQHTLSVKPGDLLRSEEAIAELLEVLDLRLALGEESGALTVLLNDADVLTLGLTADVTGLYAGSNLFGTDVLYVSWDDAFALIGNELAAVMEESGIDEEMLGQMQKGFEEARTAITEAVSSPMPAVEAIAPASLEESLKIVEEMFPDDPGMTAYVKKLYEDMVVEEGSFVSETRDTADQKYRLTMDEEDLLALCETAYMKTVIAEALTMEMPDASEAERNAAAEESLLEVKKLYENSGFEMIMEMYTLDAGQTLVGVDMIMNMDLEAAEGENEKTSTQLAAIYNRLTDAEGVSHKAEGALAADGSAVEVLFELYQSNDGTSSGMLGMLADGEEIVVTYKAEDAAEDTCVRTAELYLRSGASAILAPAASARPVIGFEIITEPAPAETLAALENADAETSVDVLKLSEAQLQDLVDQISLNATQALYTALAQLPTSTLNLVMENMSGF